MRLAGIAARLSHLGAESVLLVATASLLVFYYVARADMIGVFSPARGWSPMTDPGRPVLIHFALAALLLGVLPVLLARRLTGLTLGQLGLGLGHVRRGLALLAVGLPLAVAAGAVGAASPAVRAVYPLDPEAASRAFVPYALLQLLYFASWEVLFRGALLFGLRRTAGDGLANAIQTALSVTAHFGRAINETLAALPAGLVFGWASLRAGSVWYIAVIHWMVGVSIDWFILR